MANDSDPIVGNWYRRHGKGQLFEVVAFDESEGLVELQHFDGDIEEVELAEWLDMDLEIVEPPEDWTGPIDDIERDDLGYSETAMSEPEWRSALDEFPRDEAAERGDERPDEDEAPPGEKQTDEELWDKDRIENI
jgi:hypothetical protein